MLVRGLLGGSLMLPILDTTVGTACDHRGSTVNRRSSTMLPSRLTAFDMPRRDLLDALLLQLSEIIVLLLPMGVPGSTGSSQTGV